MPKKILIVDDDLAIGEVLQMMLEDAGYMVEVQSDGQRAQQITEPYPDLLFLDIRVSGSDGRAICQALKGNPATQHIPIILLSAHRETERIAKEVGADAFLAKPFQMEDILSLGQIRREDIESCVIISLATQRGKSTWCLREETNNAWT